MLITTHWEKKKKKRAQGGTQTNKHVYKSVNWFMCLEEQGAFMGIHIKGKYNYTILYYTLN